MATTSFIERQISIRIQLIPDPKLNQPVYFAGSPPTPQNPQGSDTVTLTGHRTMVRVSHSGSPSGSTATVKIYGLQPSIMNQLATLGFIFDIQPRNTIFISAGDAVNGLTQFFSGLILQAYPEYEQAPDVAFHIDAQSGLIGAFGLPTPSSFPQSTDVATVMSGFATQLGLRFENNGVNAKMPATYHAGNIRDQMEEYRRAAGIIAELVDGGATLAIWPKNGTRKQGPAPIPLIAPDTGLIGYPGFTNYGIMVKTLWIPQLAGGVGSLFRVSSSLPVANNTWGVTSIDLSLDALFPGGQWMMMIVAWNPDHPQPLQIR